MPFCFYLAHIFLEYFWQIMPDVHTHNFTANAERKHRFFVIFALINEANGPPLTFRFGTHNSVYVFISRRR